ncbi:MAG TPA: hypothetical protein VK966_01265 [Longimicrobiales bacterium]|nr:hypothetical protein [Longimicrobiales bacterium]
MSQIVQEIPARTVAWRVGRFEVDADAGLISVTYRRSDGVESRKQLTSEEGAQAIGMVNTRDNSAHHLDRFLLEWAQATFPEEFAGTIE